MTARIVHNEESYTLQVDDSTGDSFPARETVFACIPCCIDWHL